MRVTAVIKAMLHSVSRCILRCILMVYYITIQNVIFCYAVTAHIVFHAYLPTCLLLIYENFQRFIAKGFCYRSKRIMVVKKSKHQTSMNTLPVLGSQFFKINYLHTSKITLFHNSRANIDIYKKKIIALKTDQNVFYLT